MSDTLRKVWIIEEHWPYEGSMVLGVYATEPEGFPGGVKYNDDDEIGDDRYWTCKSYTVKP